MNLIHEGRTVVDRSHVLAFQDNGGLTYAFPCTADGVVQPLTPEQRLDFATCLRGWDDGEEPIQRLGVQEVVLRASDPAIGRCEVCGEPVRLISETNVCRRCGAEYDGEGRFIGEGWGMGFAASVTSVEMANKSPLSSPFL